jgi:pimeloyl-ACP methyl ester carboxylesterase
MSESRLPEVESWCSWCGEFSRHTLFQEYRVGRSTYQCTACELLTVKCRHCDNMARAALGESQPPEEEGEREDKGLVGSSFKRVSRFFKENWHNEFCAEHDGSMPDFTKAKARIHELAEFKQLMKPRKKNLYGLTKKAGVVAGGVVAVGTGAALAAPGIAAALGAKGVLGAASTGTAIGSLKGAALTSASLAKVGSGGMAIIAATGAGLGGKTGYGLANAYLRDIPDYQFHLKRTAVNDDGHRVVMVNGFLSEEDHDAYDWCEGLAGHYLNSPLWYLNWEAKTLHKLGGLLAGTGRSALTSSFLTSGVSMASKALSKGVSRGGMAMTVAGLASNPWHSAMLNAEKAGTLLAEAISRIDGKTFTLMGHSLGARVIYFALLTLASKGGEKSVRHAVLMGGAVGNDSELDWTSVASATSDGVFNCYSERDGVLKWMYQTANAGLSTPAGLVPVPDSVEGVTNCDFSDLIGGHNEWKANLSTVLDRLGLGQEGLLQVDEEPTQVEVPEDISPVLDDE